MSQNLFFFLKKHASNIISGASSAISSLLNLSSAFTSANSTITDTSGNGYDATLKSGRYWTSDGVTEKIVIGDISGFGGATRVLRVEVRVKPLTGETAIWAQSSGTAGYSTAVTSDDRNLWKDVSISFGNLAIASATDVQIGYSANDTAYTYASWAEIEIIGDNGAATAEVTIAHYYCNISSDTTGDGLNNVPIIDVSGNGFHGYFVGGEGATGEGVSPYLLDSNIPQDAFFFDGQTYASFGTGDSTVASLANKTISVTFVWLGGVDGQRIYSQGTGAALTRLSVYSPVLTGLLYINSALTGAIISPGKIYTAEVDYNASGLPVVIRLNGDEVWTGSSPAGSPSSTFYIGSRASVNYFNGLIYNFSYGNQVAYTIQGDTPFADTIGSNDATINGNTKTVADALKTTPQIAGMDYNEYRLFNGTDTYVTTGVRVADPHNTTISGSFYLNPNTASGTLFDEADASDAAGANFLITADATLGITVFIRDDAATLHLNSSGGGAITTGVWHTFAFTNSNGTWSVTLDGGAHDSGSYTASGTFANLDWGAFGASNAGGTIGAFLAGFIIDADIESANTYDGYGPTPWIDTTGSSDGTENGTFIGAVIPEDEASTGNDAFGNALKLARPNARLANLVGDGDSVFNPAQTAFDTTKTVAVTVYNDGKAKTVVDLGTPTVGTTTTDVTSSGFTSPTYYVNGVNTTTLSARFNRVVVVSTVALATDNIEQLKKCGDLILAAEEWGTAEVAQDYSNVSADLN